MDHHVVAVADVCQEGHGREGHDAEGRVVGVHVAVGGHVEAAVVGNGKMEVDDDVGNEDAYDCLSQGMYGCRENVYHA